MNGSLFLISIFITSEVTVFLAMMCVSMVGLVEVWFVFH